MKSTPARSFLALLLALPLLGAQTTAVPASADPKADDTVVLSPFVIRAEDNAGYLAKATLAGNRLRTNVDDIGSAISIYTPELLSDLGATSAQTLLSYATNAEVGGAQGNFAGGGEGGGFADQNGARTNPQDNQRIRGLATASLTRDYFLTNIPFDSYNTQQVTINRGANALLFGISSSGGVIDNATLVPNLRRDSAKVATRFGSESSYRGTFDLNKVVVPGRLALRLAGLYENERFNQRPAYERQDRLFGAGEWVVQDGKLASWIGKTTLRAKAEKGKQDANPVNVVPPADGYSSWFGLPTRSRASWEAEIGATLPVYYENPGYRPRATRDNSSTRPASANTFLSPTNNGFFTNIPLFFTAAGGAPSLNTATHGNVVGVQSRMRWVPAQDGRSQTDNHISNHFLRDVLGYTIPTIQDTNVFDYRNQLFTGDTTRIDRHFSSSTFTLEQSLFRNRGGFEVSYDRQGYATASSIPFGGGGASSVANTGVGISVAEFTGDDRPNPLVGRPVVRDQTFAGTTFSNTDRESVRATAFYELDVKDLHKGLGRWLGRHIATGYYQHQRIDSLTKGYQLGWVHPTLPNLDAIFSGALGSSINRWIGGYVVVGDDQRNNTAGPSALRLRPIDVRLPRDGDRYPLTYWNPTGRRIETSEFTVREFLQSGGAGRRDIESRAFSVQSTWLQEHLVTLLGWRTDEQEAFQNNTATLQRLPPDDLLNPEYLRLNPAPSSTIKGDTFTKSAVLRYPRKWLGELPLGAEVSVFYNESKNFDPVDLRRTSRGELLAAPSGTTQEKGLMLGLLNNRLSLRANTFRTTSDLFSINNLFNIGGPTGFPGTTWLQRWLDTEASGRTFALTGFQGLTGTDGKGRAFNLQTYQNMYDLLLTLLPEPTRSAVNPRIATTAGGTRFADRDPIVGQTATASFVSKGWEFEIAGNPVRELRLLVNVARQESVRTNIARDEIAIVEAIRQNLVNANLADRQDSPLEPNASTFLGRLNNEGQRNALLALQAQEGTRAQEQREYRANAAATWSFSRADNWLKGVELGTGVRWQSRAAVGYPILLNATRSQIPDLTRPWYDRAQFNGDVWLGYKRKILAGKIEWRAQLNVRNAYGDDTDIPTRINPDGSIARIRIPQERRWYLSNSFGF